LCTQLLSLIISVLISGGFDRRTLRGTSAIARSCSATQSFQQAGFFFLLLFEELLALPF